MEDCWLCSIPERGDVEKAVNAGLLRPVIISWLVLDCGYSQNVVTRAMVAHHFTERHHDPDGE